MTDTTPIAELSYEQARDELVEVVRALETGSASLEDSLKLWERGEALAAHCQEFLDGARARLDRATQAGRAVEEDEEFEETEDDDGAVSFGDASRLGEGD